MKVLENENAEAIIKLLIPEKILDLNPVIAGGFAVSLYYLAIRHSSPLLDKDLKIKFERLSTKRKRTTITLKDLDLNKKFGDIDLWFLKDNSIWNSQDDNEKFLLSEHVDDQINQTSVNGLFGRILPARGNHYPKSFRDAAINGRDSLSNYNLSIQIDNSTYWANSYATAIDGIETVDLQFIRRQYETIDELFSKFDIINCCIAYYDGKFYLHDKFEDAANRYMLEPANSFDRPTELSRIWGAARSFKYAGRFNLEFSEDICAKLVKVFIDAETILKKVANKEYDLGTNEIDLGSIKELDDPYGRNGKVEVNKLNGMINNLLSKFEAMVAMENFNEDHLFVFVNSKNHNILPVVKKYLDSESIEHQKDVDKDEDNDPFSVLDILF